MYIQSKCPSSSSRCMGLALQPRKCSRDHDCIWFNRRTATAGSNSLHHYRSASRRNEYNTYKLGIGLHYLWVKINLSQMQHMRAGIAGSSPTAILGQLTDEQADFVNNLYRTNVPATAIARVMERMLAGGPSGVVDDGPLFNDDLGVQSPPSYEFH